MTDKLLAEWFWTDRWTGSSAFLLPLEARGLYREMLTQAWRRGAQLPNDPEAIKRAVGCTDEEWDRNWRLISGYFRAKNGRLFNPTQVEIYRSNVALLSTRRSAARRGGLQTQALKRQAKLQAKLQAKSEAKLEANAEANGQAKINSPDPDPILDLDNLKDLDRLGGVPRASARARDPTPKGSRRKRPLFEGQRFSVFEWQIDKLSQMLGNNTESFDLQQWFFDLDEQARRSDLVIPQRDGGEWLLAQTLAEAQRRGLPIASSQPNLGKSNTRLAIALARIAAEGGEPT